MIVTCEKCNKTYDDAECWTICPHNLLISKVDAPYYNCGNPGYCRGHDLFNCDLVKSPGESR